MGAFALIALIAGGPLGACLALAYGVVSIIKIAKVDAEYAKSGKTPPTTRLIEKWLDGRKARGQAPADAKPARYGMWRYAWQRWQAMWHLAAELHQARHDQYVKDRVAAIEAGQPKPKKPSLRQQASSGWAWGVEAVTSPDRDQQAPTEAPATEVGPVADGPRTACEDCGQTLVQHGDSWDHHPSSAGCPTAKPASPAPEPTEAPAPAEADTPTGGEPDMALAQKQAGEVTGIPSAVHYLDTMAAAHLAHADSEAVVARLGDMKVGAGDIGLVQAAMAASAGAAQLYTDAARSIEKSNAGVRDAFGSAPDAADKQHQMAE